MTAKSVLRALSRAGVGALASLPLALFGHHSVSTSFDTTAVVEIGGEITALSWRNPHVRFQVSVASEGGSTEIWDIEMTSLTDLRRAGLQGQLLNVGDVVRVAGNPGRSNRNALYGENLLLANGEEVVLETRAVPRWSGQVLGRGGPSGAGDSSAPELGIFRVWSTPNDQPLLLPEEVEPVFDYDRYPLTAFARAVVGAFDRVRDNPVSNCVSKGMPTIMEQPYPMEFLRQGDDIIVRMEEYDAVRVIHMDPEAAPEDQPTSKLGYSTGRWEGDTLVVRTMRSNWPHFDMVGIPQTENSEMLERFTPSEDGSRLGYTLTVTDPATFTAPVTVGKFWVWYPEMTVEPFDCRI